MARRLVHGERLVKIVMTLLVRDEEDIVDAQLAHHLDAGVDLVVATDNRSVDGTTDILERYARDGHVHLIREAGDDLRQTEWVTRMARLAATELGADWILNADADEFWLARGGSLEEVFAAVPDRYGAVRGAWRNFVPRPEDDRFFAERMTVRLGEAFFGPHPLATHFKTAHRAVHGVRVGRGNHEAFGDGLLPVRGWFPLEVLHFPVRSLAQCRRKYVTQFVALERNASKGIAAHMADAYRAWQEGALDDYYEPLVVRDDELERGLETGRYVVDERLRDRLRRLGFGEVAAAVDAVATPPAVDDAAAYAAEYSVLDEADVGRAFATRIDGFEGRLARLERELGSLGGLRRRP